MVNGLGMHHAYSRLGLDACGGLSGPRCQTQLTAFEQDYFSWADHLPHLLMFLPGLIGVFVGAPLVARELESGTFRFAWTLARSRVQWVIAKLVLLAWFSQCSRSLSPRCSLGGMGRSTRSPAGCPLMAPMKSPDWSSPRAPCSLHPRGAARSADPPHRARDGRHRARLGHRGDVVHDLAAAPDPRPITLIGAVAKESSRATRPRQRHRGQPLVPGRRRAPCRLRPDLPAGHRGRPRAPAFPGPVDILDGPAALQPMGLLPAERVVLALPDRRGLRLRHSPSCSPSPPC